MIWLWLLSINMLNYAIITSKSNNCPIYCYNILPLIGLILERPHTRSEVKESREHGWRNFMPLDLCSCNAKTPMEPWKISKPFLAAFHLHNNEKCSLLDYTVLPPSSSADNSSSPYILCMALGFIHCKKNNL